jgi:hypothetical protein
MISIGEITRALTAVWMLFIDRQGAVQRFDSSVEGFWRSFQAILLAVPFYAVSIMADLDALATLDTGGEFDPARHVLAQSIGFALDWAALPLLLALLAPVLGIRNGYSAYIVIRNWSAVVASVLFALLSVLDVSGLFPDETFVFPAGIALAISLRIGYLAARRALGVPIDVAIGFVLLDFLVSYALVLVTGAIFGVSAA